jgi:hypothetical protein
VVDLGQFYLDADRKCTSDFALVKAIARLEGCPTNPTCLRFAHQPFATKTRNGYALFDTVEHGWQAGFRDIRLKKKRGMGDIEIVKAWNPGADDSYTEKVLRGCK